MSRIHPASSSGSHHRVQREDPKHASLTVWKRSSMSFQGTDGFTVYDHNGSLAFRVDNYSRNTTHGGFSCSSDNNAGPLVLMDGYGKPLLTLKPQIFSIQNQWNGCAFEEYNHNGSSKSDKRIFSMRKPSSSMLVFGRTQAQSCEAEVFLNHSERKPSREPDYRIEGSFWNRNCKIRSIATGEVAAKIMRKRTSSNSTIMLSEEVFSLVVKQDSGSFLILDMYVVIMEQDFGNGRDVKEKCSAVNKFLSLYDVLGNTPTPLKRVAFKSSTSLEYAMVLTADANPHIVNFHALEVPSTDGADVAIPMSSALEINQRLENTVGGYFLGKRVAHPVVANYVKNAWKQYGLVKIMMN
ncbi:LURP-one-related 5-like protein [Tanacetum coccineum]